MKAKELIELLNKMNPESKVLVRVDGSIYGTDNVEEHIDYNGKDDEFFILATDEF